MSDLPGTRPASRTLGDLVDEMAAVTPNAEAVVFRDERLDYAGLKARVDVFARALLAVGIQRGDRVALLVTNRTEWVVGAFAAAKIGALVAAISTFSTPRELAWTLEQSGAAALITLDAFRGRRFLDAVCDFCPELDRSIPGALRAKRLPSLRTVVAVGGLALAGVFSLPEFLVQGASVDAAALAAAQQAVPLFWSSGSANALPAIITHGGCIVLQESFEAGEALALIERERCSVYYGMGNMARAMLEHENHPGRRLGAMRTGLTIGPPEDIRMTIEALEAEEL